MKWGSGGREGYRGGSRGFAFLLVRAYIEAGEADRDKSWFQFSTTDSPQQDIRGGDTIPRVSRKFCR